MGRRVRPRPAQGAVLEVAVVAAGRSLLAVEEDEPDLWMVLGKLGGKAPRELDQRGGPGRAVVGADEPLRPVLVS